MGDGARFFDIGERDGLAGWQGHEGPFIGGLSDPSWPRENCGLSHSGHAGQYLTSDRHYGRYRERLVDVTLPENAGSVGKCIGIMSEVCPLYAASKR